MANHMADGPGQHAVPFSVPVRRHSSDFNESADGKQAKLRCNYLTSPGFYFLLPPLLVLVSHVEIAMLNWGDWSADDLMNLILLLGLVLLLAYVILVSIPRPTYLVDFACFRPPKELKTSKAEFMAMAEKSGNFDSAAIEFQRRIVMASGIGDESPLPRSVFLPAREITLREGREEAAQVILGAVDDLMAVTGIRPIDIEILVVNCGMMSTTPSLSAVLVNHYKLRQDIRSFNLVGMGCAAGVVAVEVAIDLLRAHPGSYALVVSTEIVTSAWYAGNDLHMLTPNCFFRMAAAAMLLSNRRLDRWRSKYQLEQIVRTHRGMDDRSFNSVRLKEDAGGKHGLSRSHDLLDVGSRALKSHMASLGAPSGVEKPNFQHAYILAASRNVLEEVQQSLELTDEQMEASRKTLEKFGNTSSSSDWYELAYLEAMGRVKRGDRAWQIALGRASCAAVPCGRPSGPLKDLRRAHGSRTTSRNLIIY